MHELLPLIVGVALLIMAIPAAGYVYGRITGAGNDMDSIDDAVSKGLEYRDDFDPEEEYSNE